jgi:HPt (histidine-containing phosphotransfer) domain-containing protein
MEHSVREAEIRERFLDITGPEPGAAERALLARLIRSFLGKTPPAVDRLGDLLRSGDRETIRDHAHGLKGSASNLGANPLAAIFAEVEYAARDGVVADPEATRARVHDELALITGVLEMLAGEFDATPQPVPGQ